jgi:hypothetical protein
MMAELIMKLRRSRHTNAIFGERVTGVADQSRAIEYTALAWPAAYVCFLSDQADPQLAGANENRQRITQYWGIIVGLQATNDIRGQEPTQEIEWIRKQIFRAIYNWAPSVDDGKEITYESGPFWYGGTKLLDVGRDATFWLMSFGCYTWICGAEGEGEDDQFEPPNTGVLERIHIYEDYIDPHDPGLPPSQEYDPPIGPRRGPPPWPSGPEGRIEKEHRIEFPAQPTPLPRGNTNGNGQTRH